MKNDGSKKRGFTLIELLVVIAIIALLLSVLLPALRRAKDSAMAVVCRAHIKGLATAWTSYISENGGKIAGLAHDEYDPEGRYTSVPQFGWVNGPLDEAGVPISPSSPFDREDIIRGIESTLFFKYYSNVDGYHCPADKRKDPVRSVAMTGMMADRLAQGRALKNSVGWPYYEKATEIPSPGSKLLFVEEPTDVRGADTGNFGAWWAEVRLSPSVTMWRDPMAVWHYAQTASTMGFADGHVEMHRWEEENTLKFFREGLPKGHAGALPAGLLTETANPKDFAFMRTVWGKPTK